MEFLCQRGATAPFFLRHLTQYKAPPMAPSKTNIGDSNHIRPASAGSILGVEVTGMRHTTIETLSSITSAGSFKLADMSDEELDQLRIAYKTAVDKWVDTIRAEEALATPDRSETAMERWDEARFREQDAQTNAAAARDAYKDGLRRVNYGF